jgi:hypothetical protein
VPAHRHLSTAKESEERVLPRIRIVLAAIAEPLPICGVQGLGALAATTAGCESGVPILKPARVTDPSIACREDDHPVTALAACCGPAVRAEARTWREGDAVLVKDGPAGVKEVLRVKRIERVGRGSGRVHVLEGGLEPCCEGVSEGRRRLVGELEHVEVRLDEDEI